MQPRMTTENVIVQVPRTVMTQEYVQQPKVTYQKNTVYETKEIVKPVFTMEVSGKRGAEGRQCLRSVLCSLC